MRVAGFVLVGGRSQRMGRDKARLPLRDRLLVEDVAAKVAQAAGSVALVGESQRYRDLELDKIDDIRPSCGPLSGIETALLSGRGELNLIVACDMPGLEPDWLESLIAAAAKCDRSCVVCRDANGAVHPLCAVWNASCLAPVQQAIHRGRLRVLDLIEEIGAVYAPIARLIHNVNTPDEWAVWQDVIEGIGSLG